MKRPAARRRSDVRYGSQCKTESCQKNAQTTRKFLGFCQVCFGKRDNPLSFAEMVLARLVRATQRISKDSAGSASMQNSQAKKKSNGTIVKENVARICDIGKKTVRALGMSVYREN